MKSIKHCTKELGFTLVELMVGMAVGMIVIGGIMAIWISTAGSSATTISSARISRII